MSRIVVFPVDCSDGLRDALALSGQPVEFATEPDLEKPEIVSGWDLLIIELGDHPLRRLRILRGVAEDTGVPVLVAALSEHLAALEGEKQVADFVVAPFDPLEVGVRVRQLAASAPEGDIITFRDLTLNTATYQATIGDGPVDLTYMEYELLRFLLSNQGRVWSREQLLSKVWGYEYFGGARTVDVHVRRLRAKIGEERAAWITTIRSVGYRFG